MSNPYQTPDSDVRVEETISKTKWKAFFWILFTLEIVSIVLLALDPAESALKLSLEVGVYSVILLGIFGYAYNKRFITQSFWKPILPIAAVYDVYYLFFDEPWSFESPQEMLISLGVIAAILVPLIILQYVALYRYGFKAAEIWS